MSSKKDRTPIQVWASLVAALCMLVGWNWDISWHRSIGRDTVFTPAHVAIYIALAIAFVFNAGLVLSHTFGRQRTMASVKILGFSGPSGAFITLWAILLQFFGILFDNWWHEVYGIDSAMVTPPHNVIGVGIWVFYLGQFFVAAQFRNQSAERGIHVPAWAVMFIWSFFVGNLFIGIDPAHGPMAVRSEPFLLSCAIFVPFAFALIQDYMRWKWAGVTCAAMYMVNAILLMQIFQLFPSEPRFGPVYHRFDFFLPPAFPAVLVAPALLVAVLLVPVGEKRGWGRYFVAGLAFVVVFTLTNFLMSELIGSPLGDNRFFGGGFPGSAFEPDYRPIIPLTADGRGAAVVGISVLLAGFSLWMGAGVGRYMRRVQR